MKSIALKKAVIITAVLIITVASVFAYGGHNGNHGNNHNSGNHNGSHNSGCYTNGTLNHDGYNHYSGDHSGYNSGHYSYSQPSGTIPRNNMGGNTVNPTLPPATR